MNNEVNVMPEMSSISTKDLENLRLRIQELEAEKGRLQQFIAASVDGLTILTPSGVIKYASPRTYRLYGDPPPEMVIGRSVLEFVDPEFRSKALNDILTMLANPKQQMAGEYKALKRDGTLFWCEITATVILDVHGQVGEIVAYQRDISERRGFVELLLNAKKEWETTFDTIEDLILITDENGQIRRCNRATTARLQVDYADVLGKSLVEVFFGDQAGGFSFRSLQGELPLPRLQGMFEIASYLGRLGDQLEQTIFVIKDITQRKRIEFSMRNSQRLADLGALAAGVVHDIKSPIQVIVGVSDSLRRRMLQESLPQEYIVQRLEMINRNGWRIDEIMRSLLAYARDVNHEPKVEDVNQIVRDTLILIEHQLSVWANIQVETDLAEDLPGLICERTHLSQALINLIMNSRDAMPYGGKIDVRTAFDPAGQALLLEVSDSGEGIPIELQEKVFQPFFTTKPPDKGTGLGLSNVVNIVKTYSGSVKLTSAPGRGTTFTLLFPLKVDPQSAPGE